MSYNLNSLILDLERAPAFAVFHDLEGLPFLGPPVCKKHWAIVQYTSCGGEWIERGSVRNAVAARGWETLEDFDGYPLRVRRGHLSTYGWRGGAYHMIAEALKAGHAFMRIPSRLSSPSLKYFLVGPT